MERSIAAVDSILLPGIFPIRSRMISYDLHIHLENTLGERMQRNLLLMMHLRTLKSQNIPGCPPDLFQITFPQTVGRI